MRASEFITEGNDKEFHTGGALGLPFPGTYQQEYDMFKRKGPRRITAMTNEALNSSYPYEGNPMGSRFYFETEDGVEYKVFFAGNNLVEISFNASTDGGETWKSTMIGTGDAYKVFGTIIKIVQEYVEVHQPKALYFTADKDERGRVSLYKKLAASVDKALPNYVDGGPTDMGSGVAFMIMRKGDTIDEEVAYHGTVDDITKFHPLSHFGTEKSAKDRMEYKKYKDGKIYKVDLDIKNPLQIKDFPGIHYDRLYAFELRDKGLISQEEMEDITFTQDKTVLRKKLLNKLKELDIDGFVYKNKYEDKGNISYVIVDPKQVKILSVEPSEKINEVADSPYDYIQNVKTPDKRAYRFQTDDGNLYRVQVFNKRNNEGENKLEIHFDLTDMKTGKPITSQTGTGDSIRVFSTVANILQKEVQQQDPTGVIIASKADDESRVKLYKTLARRATRLMPNYELAGEHTVTGADGNQYITIELKRKKPVNEKWSKKYKSSINCNNPKGFSQRAHCQGRKK